MERRILVWFIVAGFCTDLKIFGVSASHDGTFKYDEQDPLGPRHWQDVYKTCSGKYQSPIDIEESLVTRVSLPRLELSGFNGYPLTATATNNAHTVLLRFNFSEPVTISGGPLQAPLYNFNQMHFHWGVNDSVGSEDLINNHSYPMELHMVFYNSDYREKEVLEHSDGIVVLAFFFEISDTDNEAFSEIIESLEKIQNADSLTTVNNTFSLQSLLPSNLNNYFTYIGSLTTPPCSEGVRWIDFKHPIHLSHSQLQKFRTLRSEDGYLTHNARPVQPLSNRPVWYNTGVNDPINMNFAQEGETGLANTIKVNILSLILILTSFNFIVPKLIFYRF